MHDGEDVLPTMILLHAEGLRQGKSSLVILQTADNTTQLA